MADYTPELGKQTFRCPICSVVAQVSWHHLMRSTATDVLKLRGLGHHYYVEVCAAGKCETVWARHTTHHEGDAVLTQDDRLAYPDVSTAPRPHVDMPDGAKDLYVEAAAVVAKSPRAATALLRICTEQLVQELTPESNGNLNTRIGELVEGGLSAEIQRALDSLRVIGNNAVHVNEVVLADDLETANALFQVINVIVQSTITHQKQIKTLYDQLPQTARDQIERRDGNED